MSHLDFEKWKQVFFSVAEVALKYRASSRELMEELRSFQKSKALKKLADQVLQLIESEPLMKAHSKASLHLFDAYYALCKDAKKAEEVARLHRKNFKPGPQAWPPNLRIRMIHILEYSKRNRKLQDQLKNFLAPRGELAQFIEERGFKDLLYLHQINKNECASTQWAHDLKKKFLKSEILATCPEIKSEKTKEFKLEKEKLLKVLISTPVEYWY